MLRSVKEIIGRAVTAWDGPLGGVEDVFIDTLNWRVRYLLVGVGDRPVLLAPAVLSWSAGEEPLTVDLSREQLLASPPLPELPLTREYETALHDHYGWELYELEMETDADDDEEAGVNRHLRRFGEMIDFRLRASDGRAGRLSDFIANDENWALFYLVVGTGGLLEGERAILLPPTWIKLIDDGELIVDLNVDTIRKSRVYDPAQLNDEESPAGE
jgi:hypothetical protein